MAKISAQETTPGQTFSTAVLMSSTTVNPSTESLLGPASFSLSMPSALSSKMEPSQPYVHPIHAVKYIFVSIYIYIYCQKIRKRIVKETIKSIKVRGSFEFTISKHEI
jgi:hypothetical protein